VGKIGPGAKSAVPELIAALRTARKHSPRDKRYQALTKAAVEAVGRIGPAAKAAVPDLIQVLEISWPVANDAAVALGRIGPVGADLAVPALVKALGPPHPEDLRIYAALALSQMGPAAKAAIPALTEAAKSDNDMVRDVITDVIKQIREKD